MKIHIKGIEHENFINYRLPSMFIATSKCSFKCDTECGKKVCINSELAKSPVIEIDTGEIVDMYLSNPITKALVIGGLEPFDTYQELYALVGAFREKTNDDIVIYTGYDWMEISEFVNELQDIPGIVIKFGRYKYDRPSIFDAALGITLASDNQRAYRIS